MKCDITPTVTTTMVNKTPTVEKTKPKYGKVILTLQNCLLPEERLNCTPSSLDGLDAETETDLRILGCELIQATGILLKLPQVAMATAQVLFQRFYYCKSFVRQNMEITAMSCICLASKIEESVRRIRDVINVFHHIKQLNSQKPLTPVILDQNYVQLKNNVIKSERRVLKELGFCVHVKHPHKIIVMYLQVLGYEKNRVLMQRCWNYMNDSLRSDVFMRHHPETIACACIYLSARYMQLPLPTNPSWFSLFNVTEAEIRDVCRRILRLYVRPKVKVEALEKKVEDLKRQYEDARTKARLGDADGHTPSPIQSKQQAIYGFISRNDSQSLPEKTKIRRSRSISPSPSRSDNTRHSKRKRRSRSRSRSHSHSRSRKLKKSHHRGSSSHKSSRSRYKSRSRSRDRDTDRSMKHRSKHRRRS